MVVHFDRLKTYYYSPSNQLEQWYKETTADSLEFPEAQGSCQSLPFGHNLELIENDHHPARMQNLRGTQAPPSVPHSPAIPTTYYP